MMSKMSLGNLIGALRRQVESIGLGSSRYANALTAESTFNRPDNLTPFSGKLRAELERSNLEHLKAANPRRPRVNPDSALQRWLH